MLTTPTRLRIALLAAIAATLATTPASAGQRDQYPWRDMLADTFDVADGGVLRVQIDDADVAVLAAGGNQATVTIRLRSNDMDWAVDRYQRTNYRARLEARAVIVESDEEPRDSWVSGNWMSVLVEVHVPTRFDLDVRTQDGDVAATSFEGNAVLRSQDGDISVDSLAGGELRLDTQDGDVRAVLLAGDRVEVTSQDGDIQIDTARGMLSVSTQDGDIRIGAADAPGVALATHDGDIHVAINESARVELETNDGDIDIEAPSSLRADVDLAGEEVSVRGGFSLQGSVSEHRAQGTINGGGEIVRARTRDGSVRLLIRER